MIKISALIFLSITICRIVACDSSMYTISRYKIIEDTTKYKSTLALIENIKKQKLSEYEIPGGLCGCDPGGYVVEDLYVSETFYHFNWCGSPDYIVLQSNKVNQFDFLPKFYSLKDDDDFTILFEKAKYEWTQNLKANYNR